jgi:hypothetical protein
MNLEIKTESSRKFQPVVGYTAPGPQNWRKHLDFMSVTRKFLQVVHTVQRINISF